MYIAPVSILILAAMALGWWLHQRDEKQDAVFSLLFDQQSSTITKRELEKDNSRLKDNFRRLKKDNSRLSTAHNVETFGQGVETRHTWKENVALAAAKHGTPSSHAEIDSALDALTRTGHFTPSQCAALKVYDGQLHGANADRTLQMVTATAQLMSMTTADRSRTGIVPQD